MSWATYAMMWLLIAACAVMLVTMPFMRFFVGAMLVMLLEQIAAHPVVWALYSGAAVAACAGSWLALEGKGVAATTAAMIAALCIGLLVAVT